MIRTKSTALAAVGVAAALALSGCTGGGDAPAADASLTLGVIVTPISLVAANAGWSNDSPFLQTVYDSLLESEPDGTVGPSLATDWTYNDDRTVLTMNLRDDVTFTDGTPFNADAAAQNLIRFRDGLSPKAATLGAITDVVAVDDDTIEIRLADSDPALLTYLAQNAGLQQSPDSFDNPDVETNPIGSGPYILDTEKTVIGDSYVYQANPDYWNPDHQNYDALTLRVFTDPTALLNAVKGGQVDGAATFNNNDIDQIEAAGYTTNTAELGWYGLLLLDRDGSLNPALGDVRVRQALNYAVDREAMLQNVALGYGTVTTQVFPAGSVAYDPELDSYYDYDPDKARDLLADAGYADGLEIVIPTNVAFGNVFTLLEQQLKDVGITMVAQDVPQVNDFIVDLLAAKYSVSVMQLQQDPDWALINFTFAPEATWNPFTYSDATSAELIETVHHGSEAEAEQAIKDLNRYIVEQAWFAPWYRYQAAFVTNASTQVELQLDNSYPYIWNIKPAE